MLLAFNFSLARQGCGNVESAERFPRAGERVENLVLVFQAFHGPPFPQPLRVCGGRIAIMGSSAARVACWPRKSTGDFSVGGRVQSGSSDEEALHCETGTVLSVHLLLHEDSGIRSRRIRHAELFQGISTISAPDDAHVGS